MKVLLVYPNIVESPKDISIGLGILSSLLKKNNHEVELIDCTFDIDDEDIEDKIEEFDPDVVGVSAATNDFNNAVRICKLIKEIKDVKIVCGGYHATVAPEDIFMYDCFDVVAIGEAENSFLELVENLDRTDIKNMWFRNDGDVVKNDVGDLLEDLDLLPFPDREIFDYQKYINSNRGLATFMSSKGCPFLCTYCINKVLIDKYKGKGKFLRFRSVDNVLEEIKDVVGKYKVKEIEFYDDTFTINKERLKEFCLRYKEEVGLPFYINARVNAVTKEDFKYLKEAGCVRVSIGIEAGDEYIRNKMLKRNQKEEDIINTFKWAKEEGLKTYSFNMIGIPFEDMNSINKTIKLNKRIRPDYVGVSIFNAFKGTELYDMCLKNGWLAQGYSKSYFQSTNVKHPNFTLKQLKGIRDRFGFDVYKDSDKKRAYIDLFDKKMTRVPMYTKLRSVLIEKGVKKWVE